MTGTNEKLVREIYKTMHRNRILQFDNGARMIGERGAIDLAVPAGVPTPREMIGYVNGGDGSILLDDVEMDPVPVDRTNLGVVGSVPMVHGALFIDGTDAIFAGPEFAYSMPMRIPLVRQHGKGHYLMLDSESAQVLGLLAQLAEVQLSVASGTMDGENLLIDIKAMTREDGLFHARIETPFLFGPWADFTELIQTLMGGTTAVVQPRIKSLKTALKKAADAVTQSRGDRFIACAELILKNGELKVRPLERMESDGEVIDYDDHRDPIDVRVDGVAGSSESVHQFFPPMLMNKALDMFDGQNAAMSVGSQIGEPIVLWKDDVRFAIRTGKRV